MLALGRPASADWPTLEEALARAAAQAPRMVEARAQSRLAAASAVGARASSFYNPYLELQGDRGLRGAAPLEIRGTLFLPAEISGQRGARIEEANALISLRGLDETVARGSSAGDLVASYGDALVASLRIKQAATAEEEARSEFAWFSQRLAAGDATAVDQSTAEAEITRYAQLRTEAELALVQAREQVAVLTDRVSIEDPPPDVPSAPPAPRAPSPDVFVREVMRRSPVLRAYEAEARYWDRQGERVKAERSPPVSLLLLGAQNELGDARVGGGLAWTFPVFRRNEGEIAHALSQADRAAQLRHRSETLLAIRARAAYRTYDIAMAALTQGSRDGLSAAERAAETTAASFRGGKVELVRVLIARRELALARSRRLDLVQTSWHSLGEMTALLGELP